MLKLALGPYFLKWVALPACLGTERRSRGAVMEKAVAGAAEPTE